MSIFSHKDVDSFLEYIMNAKQNQLKIKEYAIEHSIDLIAKMICKCEIKVYKNNLPIKDKVYYRFNVRPNPNVDATTFWYDVVHKLLYDREVLIVPTRSFVESVDYFYLADSFSASTEVLKSKKYTNVTVKDTSGNSLILKKTFNADDVIYLSLGSSEINSVLTNYFIEVDELLSISSLNYKRSNIPKWVFKIPGGQPSVRDAATGKEITYEEYKNRILNGLFKNEETILMLSDSFNLENLNKDKAQSSTDLRDFMKSSEESIAKAFTIPLDIYHGIKTDKSKSTDDFITLACLPIIEMLEDGINSKILTEACYLKGEYIKINKLRMKYYDILDSATGIDKLMSNGFKLNEIFDLYGLPADTDDPIANKRRYTKNYATSDEILKGGD